MRPKPTVARLCSALLRGGLTALLAVQAGCLSGTPPGAFFATTPPGARVRIDGRDTGFVTPCMIDLDDGGRVGVQLELQGYRTASIVLAPDSATAVVGWSHAVASPWGLLRIPVQLSAVDLFLPFRPDAGHHPQRVHVTLRQDNG